MFKNFTMNSYFGADIDELIDFLKDAKWNKATHVSITIDSYSVVLKPYKELTEVEIKQQKIEKLKEEIKSIEKSLCGLCHLGHLPNCSRCADFKEE